MEHDPVIPDDVAPLTREQRRVILQDDAIMAPAGITIWRYEKALRDAEARLAAVTGTQEKLARRLERRDSRKRPGPGCKKAKRHA